ncbi:MAG TPA: hypothetical protein VGI60_05250 [Chthoniobacterales bacterium]|jgi:hypothetical protein
MPNEQDAVVTEEGEPVRRWRVRLFAALTTEAALLALLWRFDDWRYAEMPIKFVETAIICGIAFFAAASSFQRFAGARTTKIVFWGAAILFRLIVLPLQPTDDLWRYQWEGKVQNAGFNPYVLAPNDERLLEVRRQCPDWNRINHREFSAIYPPGTELLFGALSHCRATPLFYKLLFAAVDLGAVALLLALIGGSSRYADAAWYAWNPLVIYSFAGAGHFDSLMIASMLAAILFVARCESATKKPEKWLYALLAATALGLAISFKLVPVLLLPLCLFALGRRAIALLFSLTIPFLLSLPFGFPRVPIWQSLGRFAYVARVNDMFWWLIEDTLWPNPHQKNYHYNVIIIVAVVVVSLFFLRNWRRGTVWVMGTALILSPVLHAWYCTWVLPLAAWRRVEGWQVLSVTIFAYYLFWNEHLFALPWHSEPWLRGFILIPPIVAAFFELRRRMAPAQS